MILETVFLGVSLNFRLVNKP